jgi:hypothetical protein
VRLEPRIVRLEAMQPSEDFTATEIELVGAAKDGAIIIRARTSFVNGEWTPFETVGAHRRSIERKPSVTISADDRA